MLWRFKHFTIVFVTWGTIWLLQILLGRVLRSLRKNIKLSDVKIAWYLPNTRLLLAEYGFISWSTCPEFSFWRIRPCLIVKDHETQVTVLSLITYYTRIKCPIPHLHNKYFWYLRWRYGPGRIRKAWNQIKPHCMFIYEAFKSYKY